MGSGSDGKGALLGGHAAHVIPASKLKSAPGEMKSSRRKLRVPPPPKGLLNVGNTCYANAALQCLLSTALTSALLNPKSMTKFRRFSSNPNILTQGSYSLGETDSEKMSRQEQKRKQEEQKKLLETSAWLTRELTSVIKDHRRKVRKSSGMGSSFGAVGASWFSSSANDAQCTVNPGNITRHPDRLSSCLRPYQQEDAHEFLRALLSTLTMNGQNSHLSSLFDGLLESAVTCQTCRHASLTRDRYMDLSLDISHDSISSLDDALEEFTKTERLEGMNQVMCDRCHCKRNVTKGLRLATAPSILVCHLKRFAFNKYGHLTRLSKHIDFPLRLSSMERYMSRVNQARPPPYDLVAILVHQGSTCDSGHYLAYVKGGDGKTWYKANDASITKVSLEQVLRQQAYILVYEVSGMRRLQRNPSLINKKPPARDLSLHISNGTAATNKSNASPYFLEEEYESDNNSDSSKETTKTLMDYFCGVNINELCLACSGGGVEVVMQSSQSMITGEEKRISRTESEHIHHAGTFADDERDDDDDAVDDAGRPQSYHNQRSYPRILDSVTRLQKSMSGSNLKQLERTATSAYRTSPSNTRNRSFVSSDGFSVLKDSTASVLDAIGSSPPISPASTSKKSKKKLRKSKSRRSQGASSISSHGANSVDNLHSLRRRQGASLPPKRYMRRHPSS